MTTTAPSAEPCAHDGDTIERTCHGYLGDAPASTVELLCIDCGALVAPPLPLCPTHTATFPAYASDTLGETITLTYPAGWADRVAAIVPVLSYGPNYSRAAIESLNDMSRCVRDDYSTVAYDYLLSAERAARRNGIDIPELNS